MAINKVTIDKIVSQSIDEIAFARTHKQGKVTGWQKNEELYYLRKPKQISSRANVNLGRMQEFVHTLLSKIDNPLVFKFIKRKNAQLKRVELLNALRQTDQDSDNWDLKDIVGKKQAIIYGRAVYWYYADSVSGYKAHLEPVDVYDFLIDPSCGGIDIEEANFMGSYSVMLNKRQLKEGVKNKQYLKSGVDKLLSGSGNAGDHSQEETNKKSRQYGQDTLGQKEIGDTTKYKFWRWLTTYQEDGERYYLVVDNSGNCIRCEKLVDIFPKTKEYPLAAWPVWTWAAFPDLTEFWTPSYCDYAREIFMAQDVTINQMLDNGEAINKPMKIVNTNAIKDLSKLKYRRDGIIPTSGDFDAQRAVQVIQTPSINTPLLVFDKLEAIQEKSSGVTGGSKGVSDENGKVGIYEGNQAAAADRFGLLNKSYSFGYKRFAKLYELGVREHLTKKIAVDIVGPEGVEVKRVSRSDIFRKSEEFAINVEASNAQTLASTRDKSVKINFLRSNAQNPRVNQDKSFEMQATIIGFTEDEVESLQDVEYFGNAELLSECERDIETLLDDNDIKPNRSANVAYKQKMVNYTQDHEEDITSEQFIRLTDYITQLEPIIVKNEARNFQNSQLQQLQSEQPQAAPSKVEDNLINEPTV